jgi:ferredoxin-NADP reductase/Na+-translocating ferredoxin:NAD+ oxidoreductase RnfD subunit
LYALNALLVCTILLGALGFIPQTVGEQVLSLAVVLGVALGTNVLIARLTGIAANHESALITALIIFFLVNPAQDVFSLHIIALAAVFAMASKYILVWRKQHLANSAAVGIAVLSVTGYYESTWWIASPELFVPLLLAGSVVVYKVRKWVPVLAFIIVGFSVFLYEEWQFTGSLDNWPLFWLSYPALFLAFFMLTEPFSMPPTKRTQLMYGALVGFLAHTTWFMPVVKMSPELALIIGNVVMAPTTLRRKLIIPLIERRLLARDTYEWVFAKPQGAHFKAGQYMEWMLPHHGADTRGIRRYFTIASSPTESVLRVAARVPNNGSSYKQALMRLTPGDTIIASQRAGDFVLPPGIGQKIALIAGGIGVTPFVSQVRYMCDTSDWHDTVLFYCNNTKADEAYGELWQQALQGNLFRLVSLFAKELPGQGYETGYLTATHIEKYTPDYLSRTWYISGPPVMVSASEHMLRRLGVPRSQIVKDFFPGLA